MGAATAATIAIGSLIAGATAYSALSTSANYEEPSLPDYDQVPSAQEEKEPEAEGVRDEQRRKLRARQYLSGTVLSQPLGNIGGGKSLLGGG